MEELDSWTKHFCSIVVNDQQNAPRSQWLLLMYSKFTPTCFGKWLPSSGVCRCLRNYPSTTEDSSHLPKHVGVSLEYINKIHSLCDAFCWSFTTSNGGCFLNVLVLSGYSNQRFGNRTDRKWLCLIQSRHHHWDLGCALCCLEECYQHFEGTCFLCLLHWIWRKLVSPKC
jgi:hypothetical protein